MSKYRSKQSKRKDSLSAQEIKEEKKFFQIAIIVTVIIILIIWLVFKYM